MQLRHTPLSLFARGWPLIAALVAVAAACYPSGVTNQTQLNTVTTVYDTAFDFKVSSPTYSMPGSTAANPGNCAVANLADGGTYDFSNPANLTAICSTIQSEFKSLGYTLVPTNNPAQPTYVVTVGGLTQSYTAWVAYPPGYWGGWYGYPWYGWGIYYPWYGYSYSYDIGTIVIAMVQPKADNTLPDGGVMNAVWAAALNGLDTAPNNTPSYISAGITQAFTQSPYLGAQ